MANYNKNCEKLTVSGRMFLVISSCFKSNLLEIDINPLSRSKYVTYSLQSATKTKFASQAKSCKREKKCC